MEATGMSRQSFYYHFKDIYDVLEWIGCNDFKDQLQGQYDSMEKWDWIKDGMFAFVRENGNRGFTAVLNAGQPEEIGKIPETEILFSDGYEHGILKENGCLIFQNGTEQGR